MNRIAVALLLSACGSYSAEPEPARAASAAVQTGTLRHWPETTEHLSMNVDVDPPSTILGPASPSGLVTFWSIASTSGGGSAFFYSDTFRPAHETRLAHVTSVEHVTDIHDASAFDYSRASVGPVRPGQVVLIHHLPSTRYLALVIDAIEPTDPAKAGAGPYAYANMSWYLTAPGSADFSGAVLTGSR